jgi:hypothetical protein
LPENKMLFSKFLIYRVLKVFFVLMKVKIQQNPPSVDLEKQGVLRGKTGVSTCF